MADYIFTQNGDGNVQIGDMTGMPYHVNTAFKWALEQNFQSVAAQYARTLALEVERLRDENERLCAALKLAQTRATDIETEVEVGRLVRLPNELIAPYELNERYWVCGLDADDCTLIIQDRVMKSKAEALAAMKEDAP